jgi:ribulose-phosphate 3-epimerase
MIVAPSFLTADFSNLEEEIASVSAASWLHFDVMDGIFVPNRTYDHSMLKMIKAYSNQFFDCHLMIANPGEVIDLYAQSGADLITFHLEAAKNHAHEIIQNIKRLGVKAGLSIKPDTDIDTLKPYLNEIDLILVMSVEPGKGGQAFLDSALDKIRTLFKWREQGHHYWIEVDGGINLETAKKVRQAGCDIVVAGSFIFNHHDRDAAIRELAHAK